MGKQHQVSSLTFADGVHDLGYITACFSCQFVFDFVSAVLKRLFFEHDHFNAQETNFFLVGNFENTHKRFDLCDQGSCLLALTIGY